MIKISLATTLYLLCFFSINLFAQNDSEVEDSIFTILNNETGEEFELDIFDFNNLNGADYDNPYHTLENVVIFTAKNFDGTIIGFYKDGSIVWRTNSLITSSFFNKLLFSKELNNDGKVELVIGIKTGMRDYGRDLWVISWDGFEGEILNSYDQNGYSEIYANGSVVFFPDYEADGIFEIVTYGEPNLENLNDESSMFLVSKWDGSSYSVYETLSQSDIKLSDFSRMGFEIGINTEVSKDSTNLIFLINIINKETSSKKIEKIYLESSISNFNHVSIPLNRSFFDSRYGFLTLSVDGLNKEVFSLSSGDSLAFAFSTKSLVRILNYYIQSFNDYPSKAFLNATDLEIIEDIKNNSISGLTLGPWLPDSSLSLFDFTDTLETFRFRSCEELGWANDTRVCTQLEDDLLAVKTALVSEDSLVASNALNRFIKLVETEKEGSLTSEGYALLYFNAQFIAERLPDPREPETGSGINCGCDNPVSQSSGTITLRNGETKCVPEPFSGSVFFESGGTLNVCSASSLQNIYGNQPGQITVSETGEVTVGNWSNNYQEDAFTNWGSVTFSNWTTINNGSLTNYGDMNINGGLNQNNGPVVNKGKLTVSHSVTFNLTGNVNEGSIISGGTFTLNSNAEFVNSCRVESNGQFMLNGTLIANTGSYTRALGQLTINSGGTLSMVGEGIMVSVNQALINGTVSSDQEINLFQSLHTINTNSGASIDAGLYVVAPNLSNLESTYNVQEGSQLIIQPSNCNPVGFNQGQ